mgnify:CR=1 FL=1
MRWDDMSMSQKSEAIGLMVRNGVTDIGTMKQMWDNMDKRKKNKPSYGEWVKGVNPQFMGPDYNLRAAYEELPFETMEAWRKDPNTNHLPDTYKLPNHPTFSDESKYSQGPVIGGSWHYKPISQGQYLPDEILVGGINGVEPKPSYRNFAEGGFASPDHDPKNPYHYHVNGKKVVITKEDWEKYKDQPYFGEIRAEVEAEQAAYPEPEYDEIENPAWRQAYQRLVNGANLRGRDNVSQPLPQGYSRDTKGVAMDVHGNYYIPVTDATDAPYFVNQERGMYGHNVPVRYEQQQMPDRTIRKLRQPLPVDRVLNIECLRQDSIDRYIKDNTKQTVQTLYKAPTFYPSEETFERLDNDEYAAYEEWLRNESKKFPQTITKKELQDWFITAQEMNEALTDGIYEYYADDDFESEINRYISVPQNKVLQKKTYIPSRREAEKKAVIKVGDFEKVGTFANGGKLDDPPYWGQPTSQPQGPIDYLNRYVKSKAFERRSPDADYLNAARQNVDNFDRVYNDPAPNGIKYSPFYSGHMIQMYPGARETGYAPYKEKMDVPYMAILAHEYGHNIDPYFESTRDIPENWMDIYERQSSEANEHDSRPQEIYADLQSLRYQLYEKNIYDIIKDGTFNEKHLEKALKQNIPNRLLHTMPKETIIEMMNTIADNSQHTDNVQGTYIIPTDICLGYV